MIIEARQITVSRCIAVACEVLNVTELDLMSQRRDPPACRSRQLAMWMARHKTPRSIPEIGRIVGNRHHKTVLHAIKRIEQLRASDPEFRALTDRCMHDLARQDERQEEMAI